MNTCGLMKFRVLGVATIAAAVMAITCLSDQPAPAENRSEWLVGLANARITRWRDRHPGERAVW